MIASGGLSGGISSSIAGGNFWAGARQGIITTGLNHLAHNGYAKFQEFKAYNMLKKELEDKALANFKNEVEAKGGDKAIRDLINSSKTLSTRFSSYLSKIKSFLYEGKNTSANGVTFERSGNLFVQIFDNYGYIAGIDIARTLLHESVHVMHHVHGIRNEWIKDAKRINPKLTDVEVRNYATYMSEVGAYSMNITYAENLSDYNFARQQQSYNETMAKRILKGIK